MTKRHPGLVAPMAPSSLPPSHPLFGEIRRRPDVSVSRTKHDAPTFFTPSQASNGRDDTNQDRSLLLVASGAAGATLGFLLLGGPILAVIAGFGTAYATQKSGAVGDIARALGEVALTTRAKAKELDEKHHLVDKTKQVAEDAWNHAKALDRKHHLMEKTKDFLMFSWNETVAFTRRHRLLERGVEAVGRGTDYVINQLFHKPSSYWKDEHRVNESIQGTYSVKPY